MADDEKTYPVGQHPNSLATLRANKAPNFAPGQSGNPKGYHGVPWRKKLTEMFGDGEDLFGAMIKIATGEVVYGRDRGPNGKKRDKIRIVPNAYAMVAAFQAIRDTFMGKPVSIDVTTWKGDGDEPPPQIDLLDGLDPEDIQALRVLAKKAATVIRDKQNEGMRTALAEVTVDTTAERTPATAAREKVLSGAPVESAAPTESGQS